MQALLLYSNFVVVLNGGFETQYNRSLKVTYAVPLVIVVNSLTTSWEDYSTNKVWNSKESEKKKEKKKEREREREREKERERERKRDRDRDRDRERERERERVRE